MLMCGRLGHGVGAPITTMDFSIFERGPFVIQHAQELEDQDRELRQRRGLFGRRMIGMTLFVSLEV